jgi:hypothetical protein
MDTIAIIEGHDIGRVAAEQFVNRLSRMAIDLGYATSA